MRILPIVFYIQSVYGVEFDDNKEVFEIIHNVSSLTHGHKRSQIACGIYISDELEHFKRLERKDFQEIPIDEISSSGYVVSSLEAIPEEWLNAIVKKAYIQNLCNKLNTAMKTIYSINNRIIFNYIYKMRCKNDKYKI